MLQYMGPITLVESLFNPDRPAGDIVIHQIMAADNKLRINIAAYLRANDTLNSQTIRLFFLMVY
ncbi:MAG TPA: hypothetical protein DDW41_06845 [Candidatus Andersenbacteria bacterium]|nr:hypothetical protein [Candidatus Andersenbacteria bacterium]